MFRFEKLEAWQLAIELAQRVYSATRHFPDTERFGLTSQKCGARPSRFHRILRKAAGEVRTQISRDFWKLDTDR